MTKKQEIIDLLNGQHVGHEFTVKDVMAQIDVSYDYAPRVLKAIGDSGFLSYADNWENGLRNYRVWKIEKLPVFLNEIHGNTKDSRMVTLSISVPSQIKMKFDRMTPDEKRGIIAKALGQP